MSDRPRIYLDNAATSWPKPPAVYDAVDDYQRRLGTAVGRSGYAEAEEVGRAIEATRAAIARLIGAEGPERIAFTFNGTDSLNLAIHGTLRTGDHVITTVAEHNSVLRPLRRLEKRNLIDVTRVTCDAAGVINPEDIRTALSPKTRLIVITHASNVTGAIQPVSEVGRISRGHGAMLLVDAAQTLGHLPLSVAELGADMLASPGHKGLLGPLGTGILYVRPGIEELVHSIRQGGTGSNSADDNQPETLPHKYESGNHNAPGLIGLGAGIRYLEMLGLDNVRRHAVELTEFLLNGLRGIPGVKVYGPQRSEQQVGVVSFTLEGHDPVALADALDKDFRVQVRAGLQCAGLLHRQLGTLPGNGTVRLSVGPFNSLDEMHRAVAAIAELAPRPPRLSPPRGSCPCVEATHGSAALVPAQSPTPTSEAVDVSEIPGLSALWEQTLGDPQVCVAVLDGPVDLTHDCLRGAAPRILSCSRLPSTGRLRDTGCMLPASSSVNIPGRSKVSRRPVVALSCRCSSMAATDLRYRVLKWTWRAPLRVPSSSLKKTACMPW